MSYTHCDTYTIDTTVNFSLLSSTFAVKVASNSCLRNRSKAEWERQRGVKNLITYVIFDESHLIRLMLNWYNAFLDHSETHSSCFEKWRDFSITFTSTEVNIGINFQVDSLLINFQSGLYIGCKIYIHSGIRKLVFDLLEQKNVALYQQHTLDNTM